MELESRAPCNQVTLIRSIQWSMYFVQSNMCLVTNPQITVMSSGSISIVLLSDPYLFLLSGVPIIGWHMNYGMSSSYLPSSSVTAIQSRQALRFPPNGYPNCEITIHYSNYYHLKCLTWSLTLVSIKGSQVSPRKPYYFLILHTHTILT